MNKYIIVSVNTNIKEAKCVYSINWIEKGVSYPIVYIPDFYEDPKGIANGIAKILNENRKIILNLNLKSNA